MIFIIVAKLRRESIEYGPFTLGKFGLPINIFAAIYGIFIIIWLPFPPYMPVTGENMNYVSLELFVALLNPVAKTTLLTICSRPGRSWVGS